MTTSRETTATKPLFQSRLSHEDFRKVLDSASATHKSFRNGSLSYRGSSSSSSQSLKSMERRRETSPLLLPSSRSTPLLLPPLLSQLSVVTTNNSSSTISSSASASSSTTPPLHPITGTSSTSSTTTTPSSQLSSHLKDKVLRSVLTNRLTIIVGPTGSGKSTQIPPLLLEIGGGAVLCTQPRRLAVVAIAKRVSQEMGVPVGGSSKVGYHVGNHNLSTQSTQLLFTTAGILLEGIRANGSQAALSRFSVLIVDECHERSPESDLILSLIKSHFQRHPKSTLRLVLMSATFPHARYREYFRTVPGCRHVVDTITLETTAAQAFFGSSVQTFYLDDILPKLSDHHQNFGRQMRLNPDSDLSQKSLSDEMLSLIQSLVQYVDNNEEEEASILIFAPTYRHLEQLHDSLLSSESPSSDYRISVLHSTVDIDDCLRSILPPSSSSTSQHRRRRRRILLASAIADSSVTVPGVACVIDMCRALSVRWTGEEHVAQMVWASKSICDQRKGRTGRTCPGKVYRLLHKGFYLSRLPQWDIPQLTLSSCLNEVLGLVCSKVVVADDDDDDYFVDPRSVMRQCLDPPSEKVVEGAISYLQEMGAIEIPKSNAVLSSSSSSSLSRSTTTKILPTQYGEILAALPLSASDAKVVLAGGQLGLLHETLALRAIYNHKPLPIVHRFGQPEKNTKVLESFYHKATRELYLAHFSAYMFWDYEWNCVKRRRAANRDFWKRTAENGHRSARDALEWESVNSWKWTPELEEEHIAWCRENYINPTAVRSIADIIENTMSALFLSKFEPSWLRCADPTPLWRRPRAWKGTSGETKHDMIHRVYGDDGDLLCNVLQALLESRIRDASLLVNRMTHDETISTAHLACIHHLTGNCKYGNRCRQSHHPGAKRPPCRFYSRGSCSKGEDCLYAHAEEDDGSSTTESMPEGGELLIAKLPLLPHLYIDYPLEWFRIYHQRLLMLGEGSFKFTEALTNLGIPPYLASTNASTATTYLPAVDATRLHTDERITQKVGRLDTFAWNFPYTGHDEDPVIHEALMLETFHSLGLLLAQSTGLEFFTFAVSLQADQFSRWNMLQSASRTGWRLQGWSMFDHLDFPGYFPSRHAGESFPAAEARFYVFVLHKVDVGEPVQENLEWAATPRPKCVKKLNVEK